MGLCLSRASRTRRSAVLLLAAALSACGGGGGSLTGSSADATDSTVKESTTETVTISGTVTFDLVSHKAGSAGLDYQNVQQVPARGVTVRLVNGTGMSLGSTVTDDGGAYSLDAPEETAVRVRAEARMEQAGPPGWIFTVRDNTAGNALYVLDGQLVDSGTEDSIRDLHAASGWNGNDYTADARSAAPFAILDTIRDAVDKVVAVDPDVQLPEMQILWSSNNIAVDGNKNNGEIGTSFYTSGSASIYLLGHADNDTDEYDRSVISHEFAHYLEDQLSRTESIGGSHSNDSRLDMRVAFSEGWGNAFAAIATEDSVYRDSRGEGQRQAMTFDVASNETDSRGWYSESSVQTILFTLFNQNGGFGPIYRALTGARFLKFDGAASIYSFVAALRAGAEVGEPVVGNLLLQEDISGQDGYGVNESNTGGSSISLPLYRSLSLDQTVDVCSDRLAGDYNGLDVRRFVRFEILNSGSYRIRVQHADGGFTTADPDFVLWQRGEQLALANSESLGGSETLSMRLAAGHYWLEVYDYHNVDDDTDNGGLQCFTVLLENGP